MKTNRVGVDTHSKTLACYIDKKFKEFPNTVEGFKSAEKWAGKDVKWMIEGAYCFGRPFSAYLINKGVEVYEVNPLLTKTYRRVLSISNSKNDFGDAKVISLYAEPENLQKVSLQTVDLKEKLTGRRLLVKQQTQIINSIKMNFATRGEDLPFDDLTTLKAGKWLSNHENILIKNFGIILHSLSIGIKDLERDLEANLPEKAQKLKEQKGIGLIIAATMYTETKGKLISEAALANYAAIAPIECSSGKTTSHKNNKTGNRTLNCAFYIFSMQQSIHDPKGKEYFERQIQKGKTAKHARKCLARRLVRIVYNILKE
jgi:transposase